MTSRLVKISCDRCNLLLCAMQRRGVCTSRLIKKNMWMRRGVFRFIFAIMGLALASAGIRAPALAVPQCEQNYMGFSPCYGKTSEKIGI
jgi:hypothetical protein